MRLHAVARDANQEAVRILILHLSVDSEMLVARSIVDLNLNLLAIDVLGAAEDVEDSRLVFIGERVLQEVRDEAGLTYRGVADEHELELLWSVRVLSYDCLTRLRLRLLRYLWLRHAIVFL